MSLSEYDCPKCGTQSFPSFTLGNSNRLVVSCPKCQFEDASLGPADFNKGVAAIPDQYALKGGPGWGGKQAVVVAESVVTPAPLPRPSARIAAPAAVPTDVIGMIESRADWLQSEEARLEGEIAESKARLAGVRAEARRLRKMLSAGQRGLVPPRNVPVDVSIGFRN